MQDSSARPGSLSQLLASLVSPVGRDTAADDIHRIGTTFMTLAIVQLVIALYLYLLSDMPLQHVLYAPAIFIGGYLYEYFRSRIVGAIILLAILGESGLHAYDITQMIQADVIWWQVGIAAAWRALLAWLALRAIKAAILVPRS